MISGGTGLVGKELTALLLDLGYQVVILTRKKDMQSSQSPSVLKNKTTGKRTGYGPFSGKSPIG